MGYGFCLKVWGEYACFTRPEMKVERVSYDVITPSAARGIFEAIYWKPAIRWVIDRIHVLNEIKYASVRRNEVERKISPSNVKSAMNSGNTQMLYQVSTDERQQRLAIVLKDVRYVIEAHFEITGKAGESDTPEKHYNVALRRMREGKCYSQPYFGCREFSTKFELVEGQIEKSFYSGETDFNWMLWDIDFKNEATPIFFRPIMKDGIIEVKDYLKER